LVIGIETHAQISSEAKLFSSSDTAFTLNPNSKISLIDIAMPGMLPVLNYKPVVEAVKTGAALNGNINNISVFDRKNYFYPDLPQGYQISQFFKPIVEGGYVLIKDENDQDKKIRINRIHLEQDAGKSIHNYSDDYTLIDFNRSGIALMEIVTEADINSPIEAVNYAKKLRSILRYVGSCNGNMDQGSIRFDVNISVMKEDETKFGTRCEIKNLNSMKSMIKAIEYEANYQVNLLESGQKVIQQTKLFNVDTGKTYSMREKEEAEDYRYFPDPDLLPMHLTNKQIEKIKKDIPELPDAKVKRYVEDFDIDKQIAEVLVAEKEVAYFFEEIANKENAKLSANWVNSELLGLLNKYSISLTESKITPSLMKSLIDMIIENKISGKIAKTVLLKIFESGKTPEEIVEREGLMQISDSSVINQMIKEVLESNSDSVIEYKNGKERLFGFFIGEVMKKAKGKANPKIVNNLLRESLN
jgi:aspartyl-tRNA(Asn)/glutamyl-tRNA(Gln) amidotransferase subunit B